MERVIAKQIKSLRKNQGLTQEKLAEMCEVSRQAVAKWESGDSLPDIYKTARLAEIFNVSMEYLVKGINYKRVVAHYEVVEDDSLCFKDKIKEDK